MSNDSKLWLIEAGDVLEVMSPNRKPQPAVKVENIPPPPPRPQSRVATRLPLHPTAAEPARSRRKPAVPARSRLQFAPLMALTYLLGPLAILLTPAGRRRRGLVALAAASVGAALVLGLAGFGGLVRTDNPASAWLWSALLLLAVGGGFTVWARALHLIGGEGIPNVNKLPRWIRQGWSISGLSLLAPGSGLLLSGRPGRAALSLWLLWPAVAAAVVLLHAMGLWRHHLDSGWLQGAGPSLEYALMIAAGCAALGFLAYVAQALEGMRQVLVEPGLKTRVKGDYYALAVMAFAVALVVVANPAQMAHQLDIGGDVLREEGFQAIPLQLTLAASHLDPAKVEYSLQALDLYVALGQTAQADAMRNDLDRNLGSYVALVQRETVSEFGLAQARTRPQPRSRAADAGSPVVTGVTPATGADKTPTAAEVVVPVPGGVPATVYFGAMYGVRDTVPDK